MLPAPWTSVRSLPALGRSCVPPGPCRTRRTPTGPRACRSGLRPPPTWVAAFAARRYMHDFGAGSEDFGPGARSPAGAMLPNKSSGLVLRQAHHARPSARPRAGSSSRSACSTAVRRAMSAVAIVVTSTERARHLRQRPALHPCRRPGRRRSADGCDELVPPLYRRALGDAPGRAPALRHGAPRAQPTSRRRMLLRTHFSPFVLPQLEEDVSISARAARPRTSSATATSRSAGRCR